jgi:hypothetical protein
MAQGTQHEPTDKTRSEVSALASFGVPQEDIASYIGISKPTLAKHYPDELAFSSIKANATVGKFLFNMASGQAMKKTARPMASAAEQQCSGQRPAWGGAKRNTLNTAAHLTLIW